MSSPQYLTYKYRSTKKECKWTRFRCSRDGALANSSMRTAVIKKNMKLTSDITYAVIPKTNDYSERRHGILGIFFSERESAH